MKSDDELRKRINEGSPREHALSRKILGLDWYDTESQARRVIEYIAENERPKNEGSVDYDYCDGVED